MTSPKFSVVIPTWMGADVIGDALRCAQAQTVSDLEIIVAIDHCTDETQALAEAAARRDARIRVIAHEERIGWVRNVNAALDRVQGSYFFLYFHDDLIEPDYVETLAARLDETPGAMSAYADVMQDSGEREWANPGREYRGTTIERLLDRHLCWPKGAPLRALTDARLLRQGLRFPEGSFQGFNAQLAYLFRLVAAGDVVYEPRALYRRRTWRKGALTRGWKALETSDIVPDLLAVAAEVDAAAATMLHKSDERRSAIAATHLVLADTARRFEADTQAPDLLDLEATFSGLRDVEAIPGRWREGAEKMQADIAASEHRWRRRTQPQ